MGKEKMPNIEIPESTLQIVKDSMESYRRSAKDIAIIIPKLQNINIPKFEIPNFKIPFKETTEFTLPPNMDIIREENTWKRHKQLLDTQNAILEIQKGALEEQKSTTGLTRLILLLTILGIIVTVLLNLI